MSSTCEKYSIPRKKKKIRINVFGVEKEEIYLLYVSPQENMDPINLLILENEEEFHYCLTKNFSRLLGDLTMHNGVSHYCYYCLHRFRYETSRQKHSIYCRKHRAQRIFLPKEGENLLTFTCMHLQHPIPYVVYADFESLLKPIQRVTPSSSTSFSEKKSKHIPCGYGFVIIGPEGKPIKPIEIIYRGENVVKQFLKSLIQEKEILARNC